VSIFGDGYYSFLWVVDGKSLEAVPRIHRIPLSGSSGESGGEGVEAGWWVDSANRVWVGTESSGRSKMASYALAAERMATQPANRTAVPVVVLADARDVKEAFRALLAKDIKADSAGVFPVGGHGSLSWVVGRPFTSRTEALSWATQHPGARVISVPPS